MVFSAGPSVFPAALFMGRPVLELEQLRLRYPGSENWTLDGLNLSLEPGAVSYTHLTLPTILLV